MAKWRAVPGLMLMLMLAACALPGAADQKIMLAASRPAMGWDARPEAADWTASTLAAVAARDASLAEQVPADVAAFCPGYANADLPQRRAFWAGILSAVGRYESSWNPAAAGGGGKYIGIMQISPHTAAYHGCAATSPHGLKDGSANLECAVQIMASAIGRDGLVAGAGNRGVGRDWMPLRAPTKREAIAAWTATQSYCEG